MDKKAKGKGEIAHFRKRKYRPIKKKTDVNHVTLLNFFMLPPNLVSDCTFLPILIYVYFKGFTNATSAIVYLITR